METLCPGDDFTSRFNHLSRPAGHIIARPTRQVRVHMALDHVTRLQSDSLIVRFGPPLGKPGTCTEAPLPSIIAKQIRPKAGLEAPPGLQCRRGQKRIRRY